MVSDSRKLPRRHAEKKTALNTRKVTKENENKIKESERQFDVFCEGGK